MSFHREEKGSLPFSFLFQSEKSKPMKTRTGSFLILLILLSTAFGAETLTAAHVVEAYGYSTLENGKSIAEIHREALNDALRNAVIQAHTTLDIDVQLQDMQIQKKTIRAHSLGYIESSQIITAEFLPDHPLIYRVHLKARVLPLDSVPAEQSTAATD